MGLDVTLSSYSMNAGPTVSNVMALAAYDHMVERASFVNAEAPVERAADGVLAGFDAVELASD